MLITRVQTLDSTQSTNADALRLVQTGEAGPLWIVAREQVAGRGRRGRAWHSPPGNLYASLLLTAPCAPEFAPQLSFVACVALADAVVALLPETSNDIRLKWPNDVLHDGAKLSGILVEATRAPGGPFACVVGIGVNCRSHPPDLAYAATHLSAVASRDVGPDDLLPHLDRAMMDWLARWRAGENFAVVRDAWLARAAGLGEAIDVSLGDRILHGTFETIDPQGRLVVATDDGLITIDAGDVHFARSRKTEVTA